MLDHGCFIVQKFSMAKKYTANLNNLNNKLNKTLIFVKKKVMIIVAVNNFCYCFVYIEMFRSRNGNKKLKTKNKEIQK